MSLKILVTGGAGYLGCVIVPELLQRHYEVTVVDNFVHGDEALKGVKAKHLSLVVGDVRDPAVIDPLLKTADVILPLAGVVGAPACERDPEAAKEINLDAIRRMLTILSPQQRVLFPSTCSVYGDSGRETVNEGSPVKPLSLYGQTKREAELAVMQHPSATAFRLSTAFGVSPRMRDDLLLNYLVMRAVSHRYAVLYQPHFMRSWAHVRDITAAFVHGLEKADRLKGQIYNVVHPDGNLSKWEIGAAIQELAPEFLLSSSDVGRDLDGRNYAVAGTKLVATGFKAQHAVRAGIAELLQHYRARGITRRPKKSAG